MVKKESETKKKVVLYTRVSSNEQKNKGLSLETQKQRLEEYALSKGWFINKIYTDAGISGSTIKKRPAFRELLKDAKEGKFSILLVTKFDRAFRNVKEAITTLDELINQKIDFISLSENIDTTTAMGRAMFTLISVFAQLERDMTAERVNFVNLSKFDKGIMIGKSPIGYKYSKRQKGFIINPNTSSKVVDIFNMKASGESFKEICSKHKINKSTYYNLIKNRFYIGEIKYKKSVGKGNHIPLINKEIFEKCQRKN